jgi:pimeloyl-ACP methyl ester carboxylesterase
MPLVELPTGATVHYTDAGTGRAVILLHGVAMSSVFFERNVDELSRDHRVIALDFRGHGGSPYVEGGHTVAQYARDVRGLIDALDLDRPVIVGWSMGSLVAWDYLRQFGDDHRLAGVIIVSQGPSDLIQSDWPHGIADDADLHVFLAAMQDDSRGFLGEFLPTMFHTAPDQATIDRLLDDIGRAGPNTGTLILADQTMQDYRHDIPSFTVPHLLVWGTDEQVGKLAAADWLADRLPHAELHIFETSGHCPMWEEPDRFNSLARSWIAALD